MTGFSPPTQHWFDETFPATTAVQQQAWDAIRSGEHVLVVAPTGSGKTLAAFLQALDGLLTRPGQARGTRVVYVSPLKALGVDVERNLQVPLAGIRAQAARLGVDVADVTVGVRSGDTTASDRARLRRNPPDVLITTPESLYLMLTSSARETLREVEVVIVDEIHAVANSKRGTHLALSLERLDLLVGRDVQRIALSATVRPVTKVAHFLGGDRSVVTVHPDTPKRWDVAVVTPPLTDPWPHIERDVLDRILAARATLIFTNARRVAERLTARLNELWVEDGGQGEIARPHHGSVSKQLRTEIEEALKHGELKAVVATSSLELGIDMGAVDQVLQIGTPMSASSALQRIGRAGHQVGASSVGRIYTLHRGELAGAAVTTGDLLAGQIEELRIPTGALDVLAQQTVAAVAAAGEAGLPEQTWLAAVRRSYPYAHLDDAAFGAILQLLLGAYPSADFAELRARLERRDGRLHALPGAVRVAVTSGGTIPDRGLYGVFLAEGDGPGRRVGELDEEMVHETRVGETFALGATSWTVVGITRDQVLVIPAPGQPGKLPFWVGEEQSRPAELGRRIGALVRQLGEASGAAETPWLDERSRVELTAFIAEQQQATGVLPDDRTIVVERFRDELGDWRIVVHSALGRAVLAPWAVAVAALIEQRSGVDARPVAADDGLVLRLPDGELPGLVAEFLRITPDQAEQLVTNHVGSTSMFAARFRECAARSLLLPRRHGRRMPLWQQRHRAAQLLQAARGHPNFPVTLEAVRECLQDYWDLPGLLDVLRQIRTGQIRLVDVVRPGPSPFAASLLFHYAGSFMYEGDLPIAERRAAALALDPAVLARVLGDLDLSTMLDPAVMAELLAELQFTAPRLRADTPQALAELPRRLGPLTREQLAARSTVGLPDPLPDSLSEVRIGGQQRIAATADLGLLRDALGVVVPDGVVSETGGRDPLVQLIARFARTHTPFAARDLAAALGLAEAVAARILDDEVAAGRLIQGTFTGMATAEYCDPEVLERLRARCLAAARASLAPVEGIAYTRFLLNRHAITHPPRSSPGEVLLALQRLAGAVLPASLWESHVLPTRVAGYQPSHLDQLLAEGEALIRLRGEGTDPPLAIVAAEDLDLVPPASESDEASRQFAAELGDGLVPVTRAEELWRAAATGLVAPAGMISVRAKLAGAVITRHAPQPRPRSRRVRLARPRPVLPSALPGRWYAVTEEPGDPTSNRIAQLSGWLERYGVVTRQVASDAVGGFSSAYRLLREFEDRGAVCRGVLVAGLGAAQFAAPETIETLREFRDPGNAQAVLLAAADPANPFGHVLPWPEHPAGRPSRAAGSLVVIADGACLAYLSRGGRSLVLFDTDSPEFAARQVLQVLADAVTVGRMSRFRIEEIDGKRADTHQLAQVLRAAGAKRHPQGLVVEPAIPG
ncbi:MAG: DEAD/DEAH box helicase [Propionibacteriaceae bacterium]|nr:DEAD/DEAH box helicase [Propionibacteriaceae bacterium]